MSTPSPEVLLLIRCPSCGQRFKVAEDLMRRTVECGNCEHRFRIAEDVIVRGKKFYPGERRNAMVGRFQRFQLASSNPSALSVQYGKMPDPSQFEPTPPLHIVAAFSGAIVMLLIGLILIVGAERNAILDGMTTDRRLIMALFAAILGSGLVLFGNRKARGKALIGCVLASISLVSLPFIFQEGAVPLDAVNPNHPLSTATEDKSATEIPLTGIELLRQQIGTTPLEEEINRLKSEKSSRTAVGLWLRNLRSSNRFLVRDFVIRTLGADHQTHYYPRGNEDFLLVVTGTNTPLDQIPELVKPLGDVERVIPELSVVELAVNNPSFLEGPIEKLTNRSDPAFYDLNKRELDSIDLERVAKAVRRIADAEPKIYQADITKRLLVLLEADYVDFKGDVCRAIHRWNSSDLSIPGETALRVLGQIMANTQRPPKEMVELVVASGNPGVVPHLDRLWREAPGEWEYLYSLAGEKAEPTVISALAELEGMHRHSAVRLLGKIGTQASIEPLRQLASQPETNPELRVLVDKALSSIQSRIGN